MIDIKELRKAHVGPAGVDAVDVRCDALVDPDAENIAANAADVKLRLTTGLAVDERGVDRGDRANVIDVQFLDGFARDGGDSDRRVLQILTALLRRDDDLFELGGLSVSYADDPLCKQ